MTKLAAVAILALALVSAASADRASRAICDPAKQYCDPGVLPAGVYATRYFLPGMRVTVPAGGWNAVQDSPTEFKLSAPGFPPDDSAPTIRFWIDPHASTPCSGRVVPADMSTPAHAVAWLRGNPNLVVSSPRHARIGSRLGAAVVDVTVRATAPRCDTSCPGPCIDYFRFRAPGVSAEPFGTGANEWLRLYFATIRSPSHLLVVGLDDGGPRNKRIIPALTAAATRVLDRLRLPAKLPPTRP